MPTLTLLDDAMLRPGRMVPAVNRLGGGTIAMAGSTQPWRVVGTNAVVYQLRQSTGRVIVLRCFLEDELEPTLGDRYMGLASDQNLRRLRGLPHSPIVGGLAYLADGLTFPAADFRSAHLPIVAMDWVMGPTLIAAADRACRAGDRQYLANLAAAWLTMVDALAESDFAHGNLTGDNAMVRAREGIALVDYDTASWPGSPAPPMSDQVPGYRHPRGVASRPERRDDFTALMIYTSLRVLAQWPDLREEHGDPPSKLGGLLVFSPKDLTNPDSSRLFGKLRVIDDPEVQALVGILREACLVKADDVPPFREAVDAAVHVARSVPASRPSAGFDPRERQQRLTRLNSMLLAGDEEAARRFWLSSGLRDDPEAARELGARMAELERQRALREARRAAETGDSTGVVAAWERERLADHPPAGADAAARRDGETSLGRGRTSQSGDRDGRCGSRRLALAGGAQRPGRGRVRDPGDGDHVEVAGSRDRRGDRTRRRCLHRRRRPGLRIARDRGRHPRPPCLSCCRAALADPSPTRRGIAR